MWSFIFFFWVMHSVVMFLSDMSGRSPLYRKYVSDLYFIISSHGFIFLALLNYICFSFAFNFSFRAFVFFSSPMPKELVAYIKKDTSVLPRIGALSEVHHLLFLNCSALMISFCMHGISDLFLTELIDYPKFCTFLDIYWLFYHNKCLQMNLEYFAIDSQVHIVILLSFPFL